MVVGSSVEKIQKTNLMIIFCCLFVLG